MATPNPRMRRQFTVAEVEQMVETGVLREDEHVELIDGELIEIPPQGPLHSGLSTNLRDALISTYGRVFVVREAKPLICGKNGLPEPDLSVIRRADHSSDKHPSADQTCLLVELANTSHLVDRDKARIYAAAGAPTYWLVDLVAKRIEVHEDPQPDGRYRVVHVLAAGDRVRVPGTNVEFAVEDVVR